jgi:hypothetical protein
MGFVSHEYAWTYSMLFKILYFALYTTIYKPLGAESHAYVSLAAV